MSGVLVCTGHRPDKLGGYDFEVFRKLVAFAREVIRVENPDVLVTGMALGWDLACAVAAIQLRDEEHLNISVRCVIPFSAQYKIWRDRKILFIWAKVLCKADDVQIVHHGQPSGIEVASYWLEERNRVMVDQGERMLALWNGTKGGTANCIGYARYKVRPINNVWAQWANHMVSKPQPTV